MTTEAGRTGGAHLQASSTGVQRPAAGRQALWNRILHFGLGTVLIRPALWALGRGQIERAGQLLAPLSSGEAARLKGATSAALRGARTAETRGHLLEATRFWLIYQLLTGDSDKALRNAKRCARNITAKQTDRRHLSRALQAWQTVAAMDSRSQEAKQGIAWCHAGLARWAEHGNDFARARLHWSKAVEVSPKSAEALEGLRRSLGHVASVGAPDAVRTREDIESLYLRLNKATSGRSASHLVAGQLLLEAGAPEKAIEFLLAAWKQKRAKETALSLFGCLAALDRFDEAAQLLEPLATGGLISLVRVSELEAVLTHAPSDLAISMSRRIATADGAERLAPALLPFLLNSNDTAAVLQLARGVIPESPGWTDGLVLETAAFLDGTGEKTCALRLLALFSDSEPVAETFLAQASGYAPQELQEALLSADDPEFDALCIAVAESLLAQGASAAGIEVLRRLGDTGAGYPATARKKERVSQLIIRLLAEPEHVPELAELIGSWLPKSVRRVFAGTQFEALLATLLAGSRFHNAPETSRAGCLREGYFDHHLERTENQLPEGFATELGFGDAAIRYFEAMASFRSVETTPVSAGLRARLSRPCLPFGDGHSADLLMSCALLREAARTDLRTELLFEETGRWFLDGFMRAHGIPSALLGEDLLAYFNAAAVHHPDFGVTVTRFAELLWEASEDYQSQYDLEIPMDAVLFSLEVVAAFLPTCLHYRKVLAGMLPARDDDRGTFIDACVAMLTGMPAETERFTRLLSYRVPFRPNRKSQTAASDQPLQILLIGHAGEGTGLSRNLRMLKTALDSDGTVLTTITFELQGAAFAEALRTWRNRCKTTPVVVVAVNAQDVPSVFIRDRYGSLDDCHVAGFFLWESSKAPRVQHLGIRLVDEVWAPTRYVADVYAPLAPVHVVGKGLFGAAEWPANLGRERSGPLRFVTVFDFHSSIERKNPLGVVLAFQEAFRGDEKVELVLKASNVNPQHPGNGSRQWERLCAASGRDPRIQIVTERYSERQMQELMRDTGCVVSLHRSEGFGYVLADAMAVGIPVIGTAYSGNVDFCDEQTSFPVPYELAPVESFGALWEDDQTRWAEPDLAAAAVQMRHVYEDYPAALRKAAVGREKLRARYSAEAFAAALRQRIATMSLQAGIDPAAPVQ